MPVPIVIPVLSAIGRVVLTKGAQSAIKKYGRKAVEKAEKEIRKRETLIESKAKSATHAADKSKDAIKASSREGKLKRERGQRLGKERSRKRDEADIFQEPSPEKALRLAEGGSLMERATYNIGGYGDGSSIFSPAKRQALQEGGALLMPLEQEGIPVDTYTPEDQANAEASQLPDDEMESKFVDFILDDALESEEQDYLMGALEADPRLSEIFDKVVETASEFTGEGPVEGPGTGVSDSIPARLSDGEFVMTKKATDQIGADQLQTIMDEAERAFDGGLQGYVFGGIAEDD